MRFMYIVTSSQPMKGPTPALMEAMQKISEREIKAGRMIDNGGLMPLASGARVRILDGELSVIDGPFIEAKEVVGGYAIFELRDKAEALAMAKEFMQLHLDHLPGWDGTCELRAFATPGIDGGCDVNARSSVAAHA
ncbi:YciI family protein [Bradyrhizobium guangdongense]